MGGEGTIVAKPGESQHEEQACSSSLFRLFWQTSGDVMGDPADEHVFGRDSTPAKKGLPDQEFESRQVWACPGRIPG
jgi:hypothetical protein